MGDIADYDLERLYDGDIEDGFEEDDGDGYNHSKTITCKYCKRDDLYWQKTSKGWRTFEPGDVEKVHVCPAFKGEGLDSEWA